MEMRFAAMMLLAAHAAGNELADFIPAAALSMAMPNDIMKVDWGLVPPAVLGRITADNLKAMTYCGGITSEQVARIPAKVIPALEKGCLESMTPAAFGQMRDDQLVELSSSVSGSIRAGHVHALAAASCPAFARSDLFKHFTLEVCAGVTPECLKAIPPLSRAVLKTQACMAHTSLAAARDILAQTPALPDNVVDHPDVHSERTVFVTLATTAARPAIVSEDVLKKLETCEGYSAAEWAKVPVPVYSHMTAKCLATISDEGFAGISAAGLGAMPPSVVSQISEAQLKAMPPGVCAMFTSTDAFEFVPAKLCAALSPACAALATAPLEEASSECRAALPARTALAKTRFNVIDDILPAKALTHDPVSHATAVDWNSVPPEMFAHFTPDDLKLLQNCVGVSGAQMARVVTESVVDLAPQCVATLAPAAFAAFDVAQLVHLEPHAVSQITAGQIAALAPERCAAFLQSDALDFVTACGGITAECANLMRAKDLMKMQARPACETQLPKSTAAVVSARAEAADGAAVRFLTIPSFVPAEAVRKGRVDWGAVDASLFEQMTAGDLSRLTYCGDLSAQQVERIPVESFASIIGACLASLRPSAFARLSAGQVGAIATDVVRKSVTAEQLGSLDSSACDTWFSDPAITAQFEALTGIQESLTECVSIKTNCAGVSPAQMASVNVGLLKYVKPSCLASLPQASFQAMTADQLNHLGAAQAKAFTASQAASLTHEQCSALGGSDLLKHQTGDACGGFTAECLVALGTEAVKYITTNRNCMAKLTPSARAALQPTAGGAVLVQVAPAPVPMTMTGACGDLTAVKELGAVSPGCFARIPSAVFASITAVQLRALPVSLASAVTAEQARALAPAECAAFDGSAFFKALTPAACAGFTAKCFTAMPLEAVRGVVSEGCFMALPSETKLSIPAIQMDEISRAPWYTRAVAATEAAPGSTITLMKFLAAHQKPLEPANPLSFFAVLLMAMSMTVVYKNMSSRKRRMSRPQGFMRPGDGYVEL